MHNTQLVYTRAIFFSVMKAAVKETPPILLCWSTTLESDVGGRAVEVEPFH